MRRGEFEIIDLFRPLTRGQRGTFSLKNDAATLGIEAGKELVLSADMLVSDVHFGPDDSPKDLAYKCLAVNLSDLAAMGARPKGYLLSICWPKPPGAEWLEGFIHGLRKTQQLYDLYLLGGDTTSSQSAPLTISVTILGDICKGQALSRCNAGSGDLVFVSGTIGDGALGFMCLKGQCPDVAGEFREFLISRYLRPRPRLDLGQELVKRGIATACLDVSDGLLADCKHICEGSGLRAEIFREKVPLSEAAKYLVRSDSRLWTTILGGGDDYELLFTAPEELRGDIQHLSESLALDLTCIGRVADGQGLMLLGPGGEELAVSSTGWRHF